MNKKGALEDLVAVAMEVTEVGDVDTATDEMTAIRGEDTENTIKSKDEYLRFLRPSVV